jgi:hypothetical protein
LVIVLALLYLALHDVQSSTAEMMPTVITFESTQAAGPKDMTVASHVLADRFSSYLPNDVQPAVSVEGNRLAVSMPPSAEPSIVVAEARRERVLAPQ